MFGHLPEILALLLVALLVFGPKRMIEMGSQVGKAVREFRESTKDFNWTNLLSTDPIAPKTPPTPTYQPPSTLNMNDSYVEGTVTRSEEQQQAATPTSAEKAGE